MTHRLMEGDLIENIKRVLPRIRLTLWSWEPPVTDWDAVLWGLILNVIIGIAVPVLCVPWEPNTNRLKRLVLRPTETKIKAISTVLDLGN
jgi:hypothetical protein